MKRLLALTLCVLMLVSVTACNKKAENPPAGTPSTMTATTTTQAEEESSSPHYALDPLVNRFLVDMVQAGAVNPQSIHRSAGTSGMTEEELIKSYEATFNGLSITVRNASYEIGEGEEAYTLYRLQVSIAGDYDQRSQEALLSAFSVIVSAMSCNRTDANAALAVLEEATEAVHDLRVNSNVWVKFYSPIINDPVSVPCRMDIMAMDYRAVED